MNCQRKSSAGEPFNIRVKPEKSGEDMQRKRGRWVWAVAVGPPCFIIFPAET